MESLAREVTECRHRPPMPSPYIQTTSGQQMPVWIPPNYTQMAIDRLCSNVEQLMITYDLYETLQKNEPALYYKLTNKEDITSDLSIKKYICHVIYIFVTSCVVVVNPVKNGHLDKIMRKTCMIEIEYKFTASKIFEDFFKRYKIRMEQ
jgi:hypothetical protein